MNGKVVVEIKSDDLLDLEGCYDCTLKHLARAQVYFEEYHTGYPGYIKQMTDGLIEAENTVKKAFLLRRKAQAQLDMASGELIGRIDDFTADEAILLASEIRKERLGLQDNALYVPRFDELIVAVHNLKCTDQA